MQRPGLAVILAHPGCRDRLVTLLSFFRFRGLFVKQVTSFFLAFATVGLVAGGLDAWTAGYRFRGDVRELLDRAHFPAMAATAGPVALEDPVACRGLADAVFWRLVGQGTEEVDFVELLGYFQDGRMHVGIVDDDRIACGTAPAPSLLLQRALAQALATGPARAETAIDGEDQWAIVRWVELGAGRSALVGLNYNPSWATDTDYVIAFDLVRTFAYALGIGTTFIVLWMWLLLRRVRRATEAADRWARGDFSARIADRARDEFSALASASIAWPIRCRVRCTWRRRWASRWNAIESHAIYTTLPSSAVSCWVSSWPSWSTMPAMMRDCCARSSRRARWPTGCSRRVEYMQFSLSAGGRATKRLDAMQHTDAYWERIDQAITAAIQKAAQR